MARAYVTVVCLVFDFLHHPTEHSIACVTTPRGSSAPFEQTLSPTNNAQNCSHKKSTAEQLRTCAVYWPHIANTLTTFLGMQTHIRIPVERVLYAPIAINNYTLTKSFEVTVRNTPFCWILTTKSILVLAAYS